MFKRIAFAAAAAALFGVAFANLGRGLRAERRRRRPTRPSASRPPCPTAGSTSAAAARRNARSASSQPVDVQLNQEDLGDAQQHQPSAPTTPSSRSPISSIGARWSTIGTIRSTARAIARSTPSTSASCSIEQGFPRQALLMTIVRDLDGEGHAILTVKTDHGEFVLDNLTDEIRPWDATGYRFVKRQAQDDPNVWLDLGGAKGVALPRLPTRQAADRTSELALARARSCSDDAQASCAERTDRDEAGDGRAVAGHRPWRGGVVRLAAVSRTERPQLADVGGGPLAISRLALGRSRSPATALAYAALAWYDQIALDASGPPADLALRRPGLLHDLRARPQHRRLRAFRRDRALSRLFDQGSQRGGSRPARRLLLGHLHARAHLLLGGLVAADRAGLRRPARRRAASGSGASVALALLLPPWVYALGALLHFRPLQVARLRARLSAPADRRRGSCWPARSS